MGRDYDSLTPEEVWCAIDGFIKERLQLKLEKLKDDQDVERARILAAHEPETWLSVTARRASQLQQITHAIKYSHPDARGSNLFSLGNQNVGQHYIATHSLAGNMTFDVASSAGAEPLGAYSFLRVKVRDFTLLDLVIEDNKALYEALSKVSDKADVWMESFASFMNSKGAPATHTLAKQIYWPISKDQYHLLVPMFPSSLVHAVWTTVREHRFSDETKAARKARDSKSLYAHGYREYPNIVVQKFGGSNQQNVSQLNSARKGENYLLPSLPPSWTSAQVRPPLFTDSIFVSGFASRRSVGEAINELRSYLQRVAGINNKPVREGRARRVQVVFDELLQYAGELWSLEPGWSAQDDCRLNMDEQCWLDPQRSLEDESFAARYQQGDWQDAVCRRFANWLNARLAKAGEGLPVGEEEAFEWRRLLDREMTMLHRELRHD